eukprot:5858483-Pyramimonas_sp.AAC.1
MQRLWVSEVAEVPRVLHNPATAPFSATTNAVQPPMVEAACVRVLATAGAEDQRAVVSNHRVFQQRVLLHHPWPWQKRLPFRRPLLRSGQIVLLRCGSGKI